MTLPRREQDKTPVDSSCVPSPPSRAAEIGGGARPSDRHRTALAPGGGRNLPAIYPAPPRWAPDGLPHEGTPHAAAPAPLGSSCAEGKMASLGMGFAGPAVLRSSRVKVGATASGRSTAGGGGSSSEEKGLLDWILGSLQKEDQLLETDPVLNKVEGKNGSIRTNSKGTTSVSVPAKKNGGFGGLFAKK
ncbi:thylakoid soluble phosphoprotein [Wolffia australiana]